MTASVRETCLPLFPLGRLASGSENWSSEIMKGRLLEAFCSELDAARAAEAVGDAACAWRHLERAHVLSRAHAWPHVLVHVSMLGVAHRRRDFAELLGQLPRIALAAPSSWTGRTPKGSTERASVGIFQPMATPEDLAAL